MKPKNDEFKNKKNVVWTVKVEDLKKGEELLRIQPVLKTKTKVGWREEGTGPNLIMLCELLRGNAIPTTDLNLECDVDVMKYDKE